MLESLNSAAGPGYASALLWTFAALILLVIVLTIVRLVRGMTFGTFVAGGRNRKTRLAVMDATAVDSHRRLVLVRRDDVEHLILIGGPTDVVVERDIRLVQSRRPAPAGEITQGQRPAEPPRRPPPQPAQPAQPAPVPGQDSPVPPPSSAIYPTVAKPARQAGAPLAPLPSQPEADKPLQADPIDDTLMSELEVSLDTISGPDIVAPGRVQPSLDDEMTRLLGELSSHRKQN